MSWAAGIRMIVGGLLGVAGLVAGALGTFLVVMVLIALNGGEPAPPVLWLIVAAGLVIWALWLSAVAWTAWRFWFRRASSTHSIAAGLVHLTFCTIAFVLGAPFAISALLSS